ncbi:MAG: hypothetical protein RLZZ332_1079, partial [Actinomycetota bacterium]
VAACDDDDVAVAAGEFDDHDVAACDDDDHDYDGATYDHDDDDHDDDDHDDDDHDDDDHDDDGATYDYDDSSAGYLPCDLQRKRIWVGECADGFDGVFDWGVGDGCCEYGVACQDWLHVRWLVYDAAGCGFGVWRHFKGGGEHVHDFGEHHVVCGVDGEHLDGDVRLAGW